MKSIKKNKDLLRFKIPSIFIFIFLYAIILSQQASIIHETSEATLKKNIQKRALEFYQTGKTLYNQQKLQQALQQFKKSIQLDSNHKQSYFELGTTHFYLYNYQQAQEAHEKALKIDSQYKQAHNGLGNALVKQKLLQKAKISFMKAIELDSKYPNPYNGLGVVFQLQLNYTQALKYFQKAIEIDQNYIKAHHNIEFLLFQQPNINKEILVIMHKNSRFVQYQKMILILIQAMKFTKNCNNIMQLLQQIRQIRKQQEQYLKYTMQYRRIYSFINFILQKYQSCLEEKVSQIVKQVKIQLNKNIQVNQIYQDQSFQNKTQNLERNQGLNSKDNEEIDFFHKKYVILNKLDDEDLIQCSYIKTINKDQNLNFSHLQSQQFNKILHLFIYTQIADCFYQYQKYVIASMFYQNALKINQNSSVVLTKLANSQKFLGLLDQSQKNYKKSLKIDQTQVQTYIGYYQLFVIIQKYDQAKDILKQGIQKNMKNIELYQTLRTLQIFLNISIIQSQSLNLYITYFKQSGEYLFLQELLQSQGYHQKYIVLINLLNQTFMHQNLKDSKQRIQRIIQDINHKQKLLQSAITANITSKQLFLQLANHFNLLSKRNKATIAYKQVLQIDSINIEALIYLGNQYCFNIKNYVQGLLFFERILSINSCSNYYLTNMSYCALKLAQFLKKQQEKQLFNSEQKEISSVFNQKMEYLKYIRNKIEQKVKLKTKQNDIYDYLKQQINLNIAEMYLIENQFEKAIQIYLNIIRESTQTDYKVQSYGNLYFLNKKYEKAISCFQSLISYTWFPLTFKKIIDNFRKIHKIAKIQRLQIEESANQIQKINVINQTLG